MIVYNKNLLVFVVVIIEKWVLPYTLVAMDVYLEILNFKTVPQAELGKP